MLKSSYFIAYITCCGISYNVGRLAINILAYADDLVLLSFLLQHKITTNL